MKPTTWLQTIDKVQVLQQLLLRIDDVLKVVCLLEPRRGWKR